MTYDDELTVSGNHLDIISAHSAGLADDSIDMYIWIVDGSGPYTGMAWLGSACYTGSATCTRNCYAKTSLTRGPSRRNAIIETAEVSWLKSNC